MLLLAFHQKLKLKREKAQLTLSMTRRTSRIDQLKKNIQNREKYYAGLTAKIDAQANQMKNAFTMQMQAQMNGTFNPFNNCGQGGMFLQAMQQLISQGGLKQIEKDGKTYGYNLCGSDLEAMFGIYQTEGMNGFKNEDGTWKEEYRDNITAFNYAINQANMAQSSAQQQASMMTNQYQNNVSIWVEAQKAQIKAEEDQVIDALQYEETMEEMDKEYEEQRLAEIKAELESYDQLLKDEIKESTPHFGLG